MATSKIGRKIVGLIVGLMLNAASTEALAAQGDIRETAPDYSTAVTPVLFPPSFRIEMCVAPDRDSDAACSTESSLTFTLLQSGGWLGLKTPTSGVFHILLASKPQAQDPFSVASVGDRVAILHDDTAARNTLLGDHEISGSLIVYNLRPTLIGYDIDGAIVINEGPLKHLSGTFSSFMGLSLR